MNVMFDLLSIVVVSIGIGITQYLELIKPTTSYTRLRYISMAAGFGIGLVLAPLYLGLELFNMGYYSGATAFAVLSSCYMAILADLEATIYGKRQIC